MPEPDASPRGFAAPVDLEIRITTPWGIGGRSLEYVLSSPSGAVDYHHRTIRGEPIHAPELFQRQLLHQLEKLHKSLDVDDFEVFGDEVLADLKTIGHDLYRQLFPPEMHHAYQGFRNRVTKLLITSDEPWIPWEILRPLDHDDDDFFCMKFQMGRWLAGEAPLPQSKHVAHLACFEVGRAEDAVLLPYAGEERGLLERLAGEACLSHTIPTEPCFADVDELLSRGGIDLVHFVGHGDRDETSPDEAKITLADRPFRVRHLATSTAQLKKDRPLVFFNACRLAHLGQTLTGSGGWAERWVREGCASAFIAPFWSVDDGRALRFAELFYEGLKASLPLGEAVFQTRHVLREEDPNELAWLAYSLYGHPGAQVTFGGERPPGTAHPAILERQPALLITAGKRRDVGQPRSVRRPQRGSRRKSGPRRFPVLVVVALLAVVVALATAVKWRGNPPPSTASEPTVQESTDPPSALPPVESPTELKLSPEPEKATLEVPLSPIVAGRIGIVVLDRATRQWDFGVADAVETILSRELDDFSPVVLRQLEDTYARELVDGNLSVLPGGTRSPSGVEYLLVVTASRKRQTQVGSPVESVVLTTKTKFISVSDKLERRSSTATHTGPGATPEAALEVAVKRCLKEVVAYMTEGDRP